MSEIIRCEEPMEFDANELTEVRFNWYGSEDLCQVVYVVGDEEHATVIAEIADEHDRLKALETGMKGKLKLTKDPGTRDRWQSDFDFMPNLTSNQWILFLNFLGITAEFIED